MLRDGEIREIIKRVDSAEDRAGALREMRSAHPEFEKLMLRILSVISEDAVDA